MIMFVILGGDEFPFKNPHGDEFEDVVLYLVFVVLEVLGEPA